MFVRFFETKWNPDVPFTSIAATLHLNRQIMALQALSLFLPEVQAFPGAPAQAPPGTPQECCIPPVCRVCVSSVSWQPPVCLAAFCIHPQPCKEGQLECDVWVLMEFPPGIDTFSVSFWRMPRRTQQVLSRPSSRSRRTPCHRDGFTLPLGGARWPPPEALREDWSLTCRRGSCAGDAVHLPGRLALTLFLF